MCIDSRRDENRVVSRNFLTDWLSSEYGVSKYFWGTNEGEDVLNDHEWVYLQLKSEQKNLAVLSSSLPHR